MSEIHLLREKLKDLKVLFVDDEKSIRDGMAILLGKFFNDVAICSDGEEGLAEFIKRKNFDIVMTDVIMPKMDGVTMAKKIREISPHIYTIFITASRDIQNLESEFENIYLKKPITFKDILYVMQQIESHIE